MTERRKISRALQRFVLALLLVLTLSSASQAGPLGVTIEPYPVIVAGFITSAYNAATGAFLAEGFMRTLDDGSGRVTYPNPRFRLSANINTSGVATAGYFTIDGPLLGSSTLLGFAYEAVAGGTMEFLFAPATGSLVSDGTYDATQPIDVMLSGVGTSFPGSWSSSWTSTTYASALIREDPVPTAVPEPSTLILLLTAAAGLVLPRLRARAPIGPETIS